jgi:hypothetical protein
VRNIPLTPVHVVSTPAVSSPAQTWSEPADPISVTLTKLVSPVGMNLG